MNSIYPARQFLILPLGIIVRMWYSDQNPASKPRQDIRSCWSGTLAMQHPDLKCSSGFVVICCSQLSQYKAFQERPLSFSAASHLSPPPSFSHHNWSIRPALSAIWFQELLLRLVLQFSANASTADEVRGFYDWFVCKRSGLKGKRRAWKWLSGHRCIIHVTAHV